MIDPAIKDMETWEEAEKWLERHGYGPGLIAQQKELWSAPVVEVKPEPKPAPKPTPKGNVSWVFGRCNRTHQVLKTDTGHTN